MELSRLQELKQKVLHDKDLAPVWSFFLDNFGEKSEFMAAGERTSHPFVEAVLHQIALQLFGPNGAVRNLLLVNVPNHHFIHGGFQMGGRIGGVFYFTDANIGLACVAEFPPSIEVKYSRFSGHPLARRTGEPSRN
jgi:hypothetical protein